MENKTDNIQEQINELNQKMDLVLDCVTTMKQKSQATDDLMADLSIIGKDAFDSTVTELDKQGIELNVDDLKTLAFRLIRNVNNFSQMLGMLESVTDLMKDVGPIVNEVGIDITHKLHEFEQKGYFEFFLELGNVMDKIVSSYGPDDVKALADNVVTILDTVKNLTQPDMLKAMNNALNVFKSMDTAEIQEYSMWKAFKEMRSPEMKRGIGFMITFLKNLSKDTLNN